MRNFDPGTRSILPTLAFLVLPWFFGQAKAEESPPLKVKESKATFESGGKPITVEQFEPEAAGVYPAVLVIHGSTGMEIGREGYRSIAKRMAEQGYVTQVVRYFDRTGTKSADWRTMRENFEIWMDTIADAIDHLAEQSNVDHDRIGLIGVSLGSYLSLSESARNPAIKAVAEYFGGLPAPLRVEVKHLPPVLILHGDADRIVPVSEAHALEKLCKAQGFVYEIKIYEGAGHGFIGQDGEDAFQRVHLFLEKHLKAHTIAVKE